jgi:hypothetical protein
MLANKTTPQISWASFKIFPLRRFKVAELRTCMPNRICLMVMAGLQSFSSSNSERHTAQHQQRCMNNNDKAKLLKAKSQNGGRKDERNLDKIPTIKSEKNCSLYKLGLRIRIDTDPH